MNPFFNKWLKMSRKELDALYSRTRAGRIPTGDTKGIAIVSIPVLSFVIMVIIKLFVWKGKVFTPHPYAEEATLVNKVSCFGIKMIKAKVYKANSWLDGHQTIVIDYSKTSIFPFNGVRDEIREIEPGIYLGKVWLWKIRVLDFALED